MIKEGRSPSSGLKLLAPITQLDKYIIQIGTLEVQVSATIILEVSTPIHDPLEVGIH
jgi:hypothetical protein